jgi:hypothetical protein
MKAYACIRYSNAIIYRLMDGRVSMNNMTQITKISFLELKHVTACYEETNIILCYVWIICVHITLLYCIILRLGTVLFLRRLMFCCKSYEDGWYKMIMRACTLISGLINQRVSMSNKKTKIPQVILCLIKIAT